MQIYFTFPNRFSGVYKLLVPNGHTFNPATDVVRLNDGKNTRVILTVEENGWVSSVSKIACKGYIYQGRVWDAQLVIRDNEAFPTYHDDWGSLLPKIDAAAAVNTLFVVHLPQKEYQRLRAGGFEELKRQLSPYAASLVELNASSKIDFSNEDCPALDLLRTGQCR